MLKVVMDHMTGQVVNLAKSKLGFANSTIMGLADKHPYTLVMTPFAYGMVVQDWYYVLRAVGIKTGRIAESFGRDLLLAYFVPLANRFVTTDADFRKHFGRILPNNTFMTFDEFREALLKE